MAVRNPLTETTVDPVRPPGRATFFDEAMQSAIERVKGHSPDAVAGVVFGIEEVPYLQTAWSGEQVPLAAALAPTPTTPGRVVLYRRPLEHRAASRSGLEILIHRTLVEQLAALTGRDVTELDPDGLDDEDDD
jgi:predicted Zn-dependent protease with MMP-like domain